MATTNSISRVQGPTVGFFTFALSSSGRVTGPIIQFFGKAGSSYDRVPAFASIFSEDAIAVRMTSLPQRGGTNIGDLVGEIIDSTSGFTFTLVNAKWSESRTGPFRPLSVLSTDGAYVFPGTGTPSGMAFNIPVEFFLDTAGPVFIRLAISWDAPVSFNGHPTLGSGCVGYWKLDDDAATSVVVDSVGSTPGTLQLSGGGAPQNTSAHSVAGIIATALDMNTPSGVEIDVSALEGTPGDLFDLAKPFTVSFLMKADSLASTINVGNSPGGSPAGFWTRQVTSGPDFRMELQFGDVTDYWVIRTLYNLLVATWYHVIITYDGSNTIGGMNIYIDDADAKDSQAIVTAGAQDINGQGFFIMEQNPNGPMDEVGVWNRELNSSERYALFAGLLTY